MAGGLGGVGGSSSSSSNEMMTEKQAVSLTVASFAGGIFATDLVLTGLVVGGLVTLPFTWPVALGLLGGIAVAALIAGVGALIICGPQTGDGVGDESLLFGSGSGSFSEGNADSIVEIFSSSLQLIRSANEKIKACKDQNQPLNVKGSFCVQKAYEEILKSALTNHPEAEELLRYYRGFCQDIYLKFCIYSANDFLTYEKIKKISFVENEMLIFKNAINCVGRYLDDSCSEIFLLMLLNFASRLLKEEQDFILDPLCKLMICRLYEILEGSNLYQQKYDSLKKIIDGCILSIKINETEIFLCFEYLAFLLVQAHALIKRTEGGDGKPLTAEERKIVYLAFQNIRYNKILIVDSKVQEKIEFYINEVEPLRQSHIIYKAGQIFSDLRNGKEMSEADKKIICEAQNYINGESFKGLPVAHTVGVEIGYFLNCEIPPARAGELNEMALKLNNKKKLNELLFEEDELSEYRGQTLENKDKIELMKKIVSLKFSRLSPVEKEYVAFKLYQLYQDMPSKSVGESSASGVNQFQYKPPEKKVSSHTSSAGRDSDEFFSANIPVPSDPPKLREKFEESPINMKSNKSEKDILTLALDFVNTLRERC